MIKSQSIIEHTKIIFFGLYFLCMLFSLSASAQNLVINGDLELGPIVTGKSQILKASSWTAQCSSPGGNNFPGSPDLLDCQAPGSSISVPLNDFTVGLSERTGDCRYAHIFQNKGPQSYFSEVITGTLLQKLQAGSYDFSMWMAKAKHAKNTDNKIEVYLADSSCKDGPLIYSSGNIQNQNWANGTSSFTITSSQANTYDHIRARLVKSPIVGHEQDMLIDEISIQPSPGLPFEQLGCLQTTGTVLYVGAPISGQPEARSHHCEDDEIVAFLDINKGTLNHGDNIYIRTYSNKYFQASSTGLLNTNTATYNASGTKFSIQSTSGNGPITPGSTIALRSEFNQYISAEMSGGDILTANRPVASWWESFYFYPATEKTFCMKTVDGQHYVSSESDQLTVTADRTLCQAWEKHTVVDLNGGDLESGDYVFIKSHHSRYWSAQPNGELQANRTWHGPWERFEIFKTHGADTLISSGDVVGFRSIHNLWLSADDGGGAEMRVNRTILNAWEKFTLQ